MIKSNLGSFKTIGIIGGIGSEATLDLYRWIIQLTPVSSDQDHIPVLIYSLPQIPDRTQHLLYGGDDPLPLLIHTGQALEKAGADFVVIPCNTAHAFLSKLQPQLSIPIISMIDETVGYIKHVAPKTRVGLLATTGTVKTRIYEDALRAEGVEVVLPDADYQEDYVMEAVYGARGVKAGYTEGTPVELITQACQHVIENGAEAVIMGCTEIPLILKAESVPVPLINPTQILAQAAVDIGRGERVLERDLIHGAETSVWDS